MNTPAPEQQFDQQAKLQARANALQEFEANKKKPLVMWLLWLFLGFLGAHRFYLGHTKYAVGMIISSFFLIGIVWVLADAFMIGKALREHNRALWNEVSARYGADLMPMPANT